MGKTEKKQLNQEKEQENLVQPQEQTKTAQPEETSKAEEPKNDLQIKLDEAQEELKKQKDLLLRTAAEYDNYRKRTEREKSGVYADATAAAAAEFLSVADNLERALEQKDCSTEDLHKGVEMVYSQLTAALEKLGVTEMGKVGETFNPVEEWRKALPQMPHDNWINGYDDGTIITNKRLYDIKAIPTLYLLDKNKRIILKDTSLEEIENYFMSVR